MKFAILIALATLSTSALAGYVSGYTRSDGTYVEGHYRSAPDSSRSNNLNSRSNGGSQRDEYSGATNKSNPGWGSYDNDGDGISNAYDRQPNKRN